jgi:hypothetical protein
MRQAVVDAFLLDYPISGLSEILLELSDVTKLVARASTSVSMCRVLLAEPDDVSVMRKVNANVLSCSDCWACSSW